MTRRPLLAASLLLCEPRANAADASVTVNSAVESTAPSASALPHDYGWPAPSRERGCPRVQNGPQGSSSCRPGCAACARGHERPLVAAGGGRGGRGPQGRETSARSPARQTHVPSTRSALDWRPLLPRLAPDDEPLVLTAPVSSLIRARPPVRPLSGRLGALTSPLAGHSLCLAIVAVRLAPPNLRCQSQRIFVDACDVTRIVPTT